MALLAASGSRAPDASAYLTRSYTCSLAPNTWCRFSERHSYVDVATGQYDWYTTTATDNGWWCSKLWNADNQRDYGRSCDWARYVFIDIGTAPSDHMHAMSANGNNPGTQKVRGVARTKQ